MEEISNIGQIVTAKTRVEDGKGSIPAAPHIVVTGLQTYTCETKCLLLELKRIDAD
jgi:hypothetical protein